MHNELILPVPVLMIHPGRITPAFQQHKIVLQTILKDLGYPEELLLEAENKQQAKTAISEHLPNLIFFTVQTPDDLLFIQEMKGIYPASYLVTMHEQASLPEELLTAIQLGADAYLLSNTPAEQQFQHVKWILRGGAILHPQLAQQLRKPLHNNPQSPSQPLLSNAEIQIIQHISQTQSAAETASALKLSEYQVYSFIKNIFRKLNRQHAQQKGS